MKYIFKIEIPAIPTKVLKVEDLEELIRINSNSKHLKIETLLAEIKNLIKTQSIEVNIESINNSIAPETSEVTNPKALKVEYLSMMDMLKLRNSKEYTVLNVNPVEDNSIEDIGIINNDLNGET